MNRQSISVVLPVRNGALWLERVLDAIRAASAGVVVEVIAIDDGSTDDSRSILQRHSAAGAIVLLDGERRGAAAAINLGLRHATYPLIAQIDQDVLVSARWFAELAAVFDDPQIAAAQGHYVAAPGADLFARVMALDLTQRYRRLERWTSHVCTGNTMYRKAALLEVGLFDERLGYGYDNDVSYRLAAAGHRLAFVKTATATHFWREGLRNYARQQYGFGYGRLDLVAKHRRRLGGDDVSRLAMMLHGPMMAAALALAALSALVAVAGAQPRPYIAASILIVVFLATERLIVGLRAAFTFKDSAGWWFAPVHLVRDLAWVAAMGAWSWNRALGAHPLPSDSMRPRPRTSGPCAS